MQDRRHSAEKGLHANAMTLASPGESPRLYLVTPPLGAAVMSELLDYLRATGAWTASDSQLQAKAPGLAHLIAGSAEYQLV